MSLMSNLNKIPNEFRVLSTQPELRIRYFSRILHKTFFLLFFLPFFVLFTGHCLMLLLGLYEVLNLRFWQAVQVLAYNTNNPWSVLMFVFSFLLLGVVSWTGLWLLLGITELQAVRESLTIIYRLLGLSRKIPVSTDDIQYFNQFLNRNDEGDSWDLEIVTNQRRSDRIQSFPAWVPAKWVSVDMVTRINYKTVHLYAHTNPNPTAWLGRLLADFYRVEFQSTSQSSNSVTHRPY